MDIPHSLKGEIVHFTIMIPTGKARRSNGKWFYRTTIREEHVLRVTRIDNHPGPNSTAPFKIWGDSIAGDSDLKKTWHTYTTMQTGRLFPLYVKEVVAYEILTVKQLPLFIGYKHTTPLLEQLIKG